MMAVPLSRILVEVIVPLLYPSGSAHLTITSSRAAGFRAATVRERAQFVQKKSARLLTRAALNADVICWIDDAAEWLTRRRLQFQLAASRARD